MANIKANTSDIQTAGGQIGTHATNMGDMLDQLTKLVAGMGDSWQGTGHDSFDNFMRDWNSTASQMHQHLDTVHKNVKQTGVSFEDLDTQISKGFQI